MKGKRCNQQVAFCRDVLSVCYWGFGASSSRMNYDTEREQVYSGIGGSTCLYVLLRKGERVGMFVFACCLPWGTWVRSSTLRIIEHSHHSVARQALIRYAAWGSRPSTQVRRLVAVRRLKRFDVTRSRPQDLG